MDSFWDLQVQRIGYPQPIWLRGYCCIMVARALLNALFLQTKVVAKTSDEPFAGKRITLPAKSKHNGLRSVLKYCEDCRSYNGSNPSSAVVRIPCPDPLSLEYTLNVWSQANSCYWQMTALTFLTSHLDLTSIMQTIVKYKHIDMNPI